MPGESVACLCTCPSLLRDTSCDGGGYSIGPRMRMKCSYLIVSEYPSYWKDTHHSFSTKISLSRTSLALGSFSWSAPRRARDQTQVAVQYLPQDDQPSWSRSLGVVSVSAWGWSRHVVSPSSFGRTRTLRFSWLSCRVLPS